MGARIGVVGSNMVDLIAYGERLPVPGETLEASRFEIGAGGKGANQAVAAAKLGAEVVMVSRVGDDLFGQQTVQSLRTAGIDVRHVTPAAGVSNGVAPIFVAANGENSILIIKGANELLSPADVDRAADALLSCDLILLQLEVPLETVYHVIDWAGRNGRRVLLNPAPATAQLAFDRIAAVDFFVPNQTELAILTGMPTATEREAVLAARTLLERGMRSVIVTLGADGAVLLEGDETVHIEAVRVQAIDTTGAGDAFIGAFACFHAGGVRAAEALTSAARYAALSVTRQGTQKAFGSAAEFAAFAARS